MVRPRQACPVGMRPYRGQARHPVWDEVDARQFLETGQDCSPIPAAFGVAYELPQVSRVPRHVAWRYLPGQPPRTSGRRGFSWTLRMRERSVRALG
jgi:hypothetical protein